MSEEIYVVEPILAGRWERREVWRQAFPYTWQHYMTFNDVQLRDPNGRDGEWYAIITLPHKSLEYEGLAIPVFEGDVERREWEARRRR